MPVLDFLPFYKDQTRSDRSCIARLIQSSAAALRSFSNGSISYPVAMQSLYPSVIIRIRHFPSMVKAKVSSYGAWRFDLIEKAVLAWHVLAGSGGASAARTLSLCVRAQ